MDRNIDLNELNDQQRTLLSQLSYLDINAEGREKIKEGGLTLNELKDYLAEPNAPFCGSMGLDKEVFLTAARAIDGDKTVNELIPTDAELLDDLINNGLGDLKIKDANTEQTITSSGLQAIAFEDGHNNVGISYRGTDLDFSRGALRDIIESDVMEYFTGGSTQSKEALDYFDQNKSQDGNNFLYGHSLGGNLVSHVYLQNYDNVKEAFSINANPINEKVLDTQEKIDAFNDPEKFKFCSIASDAVSSLKSTEKYQDNITYIQNALEKDKPGDLSHLVRCASFDENGNFITTTREQAREQMTGMSKIVTDFLQTGRETMNVLQDDSKNFSEKGKELFVNWKEDFSKQLDNVQVMWKDSIENFHTLKDKVVDFAQEKGGEFKEKFDSLDMKEIFGDGIVGSAASGAKDGLSQASQKVGEGIDALKDHVEKVDFQGITDGVKDKFNSAKEKIEQIDVKDIMKDVGDKFNSVKEQIQNIDMNAVINDVKDNFNWAKEQTGKKLNWAKDQIGEIGEQIGDIFDRDR